MTTNPLIISIVTPNHNYDKYIAEAIESVIFQKGQFYIDYIIADGASTDQSLQKIKTYKNYLESTCIKKNIRGYEFYSPPKVEEKENFVVKNPLSISCKGIRFSWFSEKDDGQYDAVKKGLDMAIGDIMAYLNSDDMYLPNAFSKVCKAFSANSEILWLKGLNGFYDTDGTYSSKHINHYSNYILKRGFYNTIDLPGIQQESTFWKRSLYDAVGGMPRQYRYAGDFALWMAFATKAKASLYQPRFHLSGIRIHDGQKHISCREDYHKEVTQILNEYGIRRNYFRRIHSKLIHEFFNYELDRLSPGILLRGIFLKSLLPTLLKDNNA